MNTTIITRSLLLALALLISVSPARADERPTGVKPDNAALIRGLYDAVNRKDLQTIASFGAPNSEWLDVPFNYTSTGVKAIIDPWKAWFDIFPDATCEVRSLVALGDYVVAQGIGRGTHRGVFNSPAGRIEPTGRPIEVQFCDVYRLENGKIIRADSYFDFYGVLRQLVPSVPAAAPAH
jgi:predicted ester cyclase